MLKKRPIVGISASVRVDTDGYFPGFESAHLNSCCINALVNSGAVPIVLPIIDDEEAIEKQIALLDAVVLSGGHDVNPFLWGEEPKKQLGDIFPRRDIFDSNLIKYAVQYKKPILGICRGSQILNVYFGGTLYQDIFMDPQFFVKHNQKTLPEEPIHSVSIKKDSLFYPLFGNKVYVNSFHHMAINRIAKCFEVTGLAADKTVELFESKENPLIVGVQWHPEIMSSKHEIMQQFFNVFMSKV